MRIFRLSTARVKIFQIPHVIFQTKSQFFFKVWITSQCRERSFFCTFLAETLYAIDKSSTSKCKFSDLPLLALKFTKFFMSCLEPRVSFPSNFASLFSVMRHNSSALFRLNFYMLWTNFKVQISRPLTALMKIKQMSYISLFKPRVSFPLNFALPFNFMTHNSSERSR